MASRIKGLTIEIGGNTTKLQSALKGVNTQISRTSTALKDVDKLLKFNPGNTELLRQKQQMLTQSIEQTKDKLDQLKAAQKNMDASGVDKNSRDYQALRREIIDTENQLKSLESQFKQFGTVAGQAVIGAGQKMQEFGRKIQDVGRHISDLGGKLTRTVTVPIAAVGTAAVKTAAEFEAGMSEVQAISGASAQEMERLESAARQMGTESVFSASEAAQAYKYMGMAGWDATQMVEGLPGIMNLAAASGEELGTVSDIVTDGLTAFGLSAEDAAHFADVLATAATNSNTNVSMMGESFKYAAPLAGSLGYSVEDVSLALGLMANAGIKSTQAGTTLRTLLQNMAKPTDSMQAAMARLGVSLEDGEGGMLSLHSVLKDLRTGFGQLKIPQEELTRGMEELDAAFDDGTLSEKDYAKAQEELMLRAYGAEGALMAENAAALAGARGLSGLLAVVNASDEEFDGLYNSLMASEGAAQRMADTMSDNLIGQMKKLKNNAKELGIQFGNIMMPAIKKAVTVIQDLTKWLQNLSPKQQETIVKMGALAAAVGPVLIVVGKLTTAFGGVVTNIGKLTSGFGHLINIVAANPFAAVAVGAVALAAGIVKVHDAMTTTPFEEFQAGLAASNQEMEKVREVTAEYQSLAEQRDIDVQKAQVQAEYTQRQKDELDGLLSKTGELTEEEQQRANFLAGELMRACGIAIDSEKKLTDQYLEQKGSIEQVMDSIRNKAILQANESMYVAAIQNETKARDAATTAYNAWSSAAEKANGLASDYNAKLAEYNAATEKAAGSANAFGGETEVLWNEVTKAKSEMEAAQSAVAGLEQEYISAESALAGYSSQITNYEAVAAAIASGAEVDKVAIENLSQGFITATSNNAVALAQQVADAQTKYEELRQAAASGYQNVSQETLNGARDAVEKAVVEFGKLPPESKQALASLPGDLGSSIQAASQLVNSSATAVVKGGVEQMRREAAVAKTVGQTQGNMFDTGFMSTKGKINSDATSVAKGATDILGKIGSNQGKTSGTNTGKAYSTGVSQTRSTAEGSGKSVATGTTNAMNSTGKTGGQTAGVATGNAFASGVTSTSGAAGTAGSGVASSAASTMSSTGSTGAQQAGANTGAGYAQGILSQEGAVRSAAAHLANAANQEYNSRLQIKSPSRVTMKAGLNTGKGWALGIEKAAPLVKKAVDDLVHIQDIGSSVGTMDINLDAMRIHETRNPVLEKIDTMTEMMSGLLMAVEAGGVVVLDGDTLVGRITPTLNRNLGVLLRGSFA